MGMIKEFRDFAMRGNVIDMAVGIVIGAAFGKIVTALVDRIIMPITALLTGGINVADRSFRVPLPAALQEQGFKPAEIGWGAFAQAVIDFIIVAWAIFMVIKLINRLAAKKAPAPPVPREDLELLRQIRDSLKAGSRGA